MIATTQSLPMKSNKPTILSLIAVLEEREGGGEKGERERERGRRRVRVRETQRERVREGGRDKVHV